MAPDGGLAQGSEHHIARQSASRRATKAWNVAQQSPITKGDIQVATPAAIAGLDASFFRMRFDRLTSKNRQYLRAMAALGDDPQRSADVAARLMQLTNAAGPARDSLIRKGMIYSPEHSIVASAVPLFGDFMRRAMPEGGE